MLTSLERFFYKIIFEDHACNYISMGKRNTEARMKECHLKYRKGKSFYDALNAIWGYESAPISQDYNKHLEWACPRLDDVLTIDWPSYLKSI